MKYLRFPPFLIGLLIVTLMILSAHAVEAWWDFRAAVREGWRML